MRYYTTFSLLCGLLLTTTMGCEQIDQLAGGGVDKPSVSYSATTLEADFYQAGNSSAPSLDWNGEQGSVTLGSSITGLDINSTTGKLEWTKLLPPGTHMVDVVVSNSEGQVVVPITINNALKGNFEGLYDGDVYFGFDLMADGTLELRANSKSNPDEASGNWEIDGDEIKGIYAYTGTGSPYAFKGNLKQTQSKATIQGNWYFDDSFAEAQKGGTFETTYE